MVDIAKLPFAQTRRAGQLVFLSGQIGLLDGALVPGGIEAETEQAFVNLRAVLDRCQLVFSGRVAQLELVDVTVFLTNMDDYTKMNEVYAVAIGHNLPTRTCIGVAALPFGARIEIKAIAEF